MPRGSESRASCSTHRVLAAPTDVRFQARVFHHLLRWKPGPKPAGGVLYEVQYRRVWSGPCLSSGSEQPSASLPAARRVGKDSWRAAANCTRIALDSCDLTCETQQPAFHYLARVRAIAGNRSSAWTWTRRFTPSEGSARGRRRASPSGTRNGSSWRAEGAKPAEQYCISVKPRVASLPNAADWTEEQCVSIPPLEGEH
uniref:Fibronectin type-III domain-containing protein n=1 Tax=Pseudonaja textilis TaxID=8673 RepID=A0A670Y5N4_PSETE